MKIPVASSQRRAPGPRGAPGLGSALDLQRLGQVRFYVENWQKYGDIVRFNLGPFVAHILAHPDHLHHVLAAHAANYDKGASYAKVRPFLGLGLLTSEGQLWRSQRRLMQPPFTQRAVQGYAAAILEATEAMLAEWQQAAQRGAALIVNREMARLALIILGKTIFGRDLGQVAETILQAAGLATALVNRRLASFIDLPLTIPTPANRRFRAAMRSLDRVVYELIEARRQPPETPDLLGRLLTARDEETGAGMSDRQIRDEVVTLLFAGHETSAVALTWTWYLLAQHPEVEARLHQELATVLGGRPPTAEDLAHLTYTRMVVEETMRLYPPVWTFPRAAIGDDEIGGYHIPARSLIFPSQYLTHRHPAFWERPAEFDPGRFAPEHAESRLRYAYYPFGGGPRTCIGVHFAMLELCLVVGTIAQRARLRLLPGPPIEPKSVVTLHPSRDVLMMMEVRRA